MRRILLGLLAVIALACVIAYANRGEIAMQIADRGITRTMTTDPLAEFGDGLHLVVCGAGGPMADPRRAGPCLAVIAGPHLMLFDAGAGAGRGLGLLRVPPARLERLFLTHYHSDHIDGLGEVMLQRWAGGGHKEPLPVHGPGNVGEVVEGFNLAYRQDQAARVAHHGDDTVPASGAGGTPLSFDPPETGEIVVFAEGDLTVSAFTVSHNPAEFAVGYKVTYKDRSLVISGDTSKSPDVAAAAKGVDLLVHEALSTVLVDRIASAATAAGRTNIAKIMRDIPGYHTSPVEAAETAAEAGVQHLVLVHIVPPLPLFGLEAAFLKGVDKVYSGKVTLAIDGTQISLPAGSKRIIATER